MAWYEEVFQPARDVCTAICLFSLLLAAWLYYRSPTGMGPSAFIEVSLIFAVLAECYAKD